MVKTPFIRRQGGLPTAQLRCDAGHKSKVLSLARAKHYRVGMERYILNPMKAAGRRTKGQRGEREAAAIWKSLGFPKACRSPGSGAIRSWGAGDLSPWPGDLAFTGPFLVEVKYDERMRVPGRSGVVGEAFVRQTARALEKLAKRHNGTVGARHRTIPVLMARGSWEPWRYFVAESDLRGWLGVESPTLEGSVWVELDGLTFPDFVAALT